MVATTSGNPARLEIVAVVAVVAVVAAVLVATSCESEEGT
jgi:hypothetical protein